SRRLRGGDIAPLRAGTPRLEERGYRRRRRCRIGRTSILRCLGQQVLGQQILGRATIGRRRIACVLAGNGRADGAPAVSRGHRLVSTTGSAAVSVAIVDYVSGQLHSAGEASERDRGHARLASAVGAAS